MSTSLEKILVTGGTGFIGKALLSKLSTKQCEATSTIHNMPLKNNHNITQHKIKGINSKTDWSHIVSGVNTVIHLAGRAHISNNRHSGSLSVFREINTNGTLNLAKQAALAGVNRFVFLSSIGVNGDKTTSNPFTEQDIPDPKSYYATSKYEAEIGLIDLSRRTNMEIVIIRPPLVYGQGAPGNFDRIIKIISLGIPLPLGSIKNERSFIALENLIDFITICTEHPAAANQIFTVSDNEDMSTTELLRRICKALNKPAYLFSFPQVILEIFLKLIGKNDISHRLYCDLKIDTSKSQKILNWSPPLSVEEALKKIDHA